MHRLLSRLLLLPLVALSACAGDASSRWGASCRIEKAAQLPLLAADNFLFAPVTVDGTQILLVVDTGSETTLLTPETVARTRLQRDEEHRSLLLGVAGRVTTPNVFVRSFRLGDIVLQDKSVGVTPITPITDLGRPIGGLLGTDVLGKYDVEIDAPGRRMTLYRVSDCDSFVPWGGRAVTIPASLTGSGRLYLPVAIDSKPVRAQLDTGARNSLVTLHVANRVGVSDRALEADPVRFAHGVGMAGIALRRHMFARVSVGSLTADDVELNVANTLLPEVEMLLGADWVEGKRIWISFEGKRVFVADAGIRSADNASAAR